MKKSHVSVIKEARIKKGLTQSDLALRLCVSRPSYIAIEQGTKELTISQYAKIVTALNITLVEVEQNQLQNYEKYKQMIIAFLQKSVTTTKTKLAKLVYLADVGWYYYHLHSMSGMQYRKIQYGPVADSYFRAIDELYEEGMIEIKQTDDGAMIVSLVPHVKKKELTFLSRAELVLIGNIQDKWKNKKTKEIVNFTHNQLPYLCAEDNSIINLGLITQEDPHEYY